MKKCKSCKSEIDSKAKVCPNCRKKQGFPKVLIILGILVAVAIIAIAAGGGSSENKETETERFTLEEGHSGAPDEAGFAYYVEGYIKNNKDKNYSYIQVTFTTYDSEGNTLGTCLDNNSGLEANGRWKFKAICVENIENISSYKLTDITGY